MKILIAEDEQRTRMGMSHLIGELGDQYEIVALVSNGRTALDLLSQLKPDVAFVDIKMPFLDGISVIREARSRGLTTEFVVVSAYGDFDLAQQAIALDVAGYLLKPLTREEAQHTLKKIEGRLEGRAVYTMQRDERLREKYPDAHPLILKSLDLLQKKYTGKVSQKDLAAELGISPEYFSYLFTQNIGQNFSVFLKNYRIEQAEKLYRSGKCEKREVPYKVGFSDVKYFNRVFHEVTGQSPSDYIASLS